jgi:hypothetical protein
MLKQIKRCIPDKVKKAVKRRLHAIKRSIYAFRNELEYVEVHLTDHCNLSCKGCTHYSTIAAPRYTDVHQYQLDMRRLAQLFRNIRMIRLLGGEPLLHPDPAAFITTTRAAFPQAAIQIITNGILLPKASQDFWDACRNTNTSIDITVYPPMGKRIAELRSLCDANGVTLTITNVVRTFHAHHNLKGDSDKQKSFNLCRKREFCPLLRDGRIYNCPMSALVHYFNEQFGYQISADAGFDIHSPSASGRAILRKLRQPIDTCKWCSYDYSPFEWINSNRNSRLPEDWDTAEPTQGPKA